MAKGRAPKIATKKELHNKSFNVEIGTVHKNKPKSVYIKYKLWLAWKNKTNLDFQREIAKINKFARQYSYNVITSVAPNQSGGEYFDHLRTIVNIKSPAVGLKYGDECYVEVDITVFQNDTKKIMWEDAEMLTLYRELNHGLTFYFNNHEQFKIGLKGKVIK